MWKRFITLALLSSSLWITQQVIASETLERDFQQPVQVEADREFLDLREDLFRVEGNVIITQGSLIIKADVLEIQGFGNDEGQAERFIARGSPATYEQDIDVDLRVTASAEEITYDATNRLLVLAGNAELLQSGNYLRASRISYDLERQQITATGDEQEGQRVRTSLQPRERSPSPPENNDEGNN